MSCDHNPAQVPLFPGLRPLEIPATSIWKFLDARIPSNIWLVILPFSVNDLAVWCRARATMDAQNNDIEIVLDAIELAKRQLSPSDRCHAEMHDYQVFEVTLKAMHRKRGQLNRKDRFAYLVAHKDLHRRINRENSRYRNRERTFDEHAGTNETSLCPTSSTDPVVEACRREQSEQVNNALRQLPTDQEKVLRSLYFSTSSDQNLRCLAARLGVTRQTVARRHDQGLATLQRLLRGNPKGC